MSSPKVSVVIVTKNRSLDLSHLFGSLLSGSTLPDEILVIDNESTDNTKELVESISDTVSFPIRYEYYSGSGYPKIYNAGLKSATFEYVAFIDDDCIADIKWLESLKKSLQKSPEVFAVMGWCETYYEKNIYSLATLLFTNEWKRRSISKNKVTDCEVLDNKNVVYNRSLLFKNNLEYDESRANFFSGAAEDCDLGMQIQAAGGQVIFNQEMLIWHKDPQDWLWFMKKNVASWYAYESLQLKWNIFEREKYKKPQRNLKNVVFDFSKQKKLGLFERLRLYIIAKQVLFLNKVLSFFGRKKW